MKKTAYYIYRLPNGKTPKNWVVGTPIRVFGVVVLIKWKIATSDYKWNNLDVK